MNRDLHFKERLRRLPDRESRRAGVRGVFGCVACEHIANGSNRRTASGFTLIEVVAILAVIAILAAALAPVLIKRMDQVAGEKEANQLRAYADAFRQGVIKTRAIPDQTGWDLLISSNLSVSIAQVRTNDRRVARVFLIDPTFRIGSSNSPSLPPYNQATNGINGSAIQPINPRLMLLSSLSQVLPIGSGTNAAFDVIWNTPDGAIPSHSAWSGYRKGDDLKIQRIHLADVFVPMTLNNEDSNWGRFSIDQTGPVTSPAKSFSGYFVASTHLRLFDCTNSLPTYSEILYRAKSFDFANCSWQPGGDFKSKAIDRPSPIDLQLAANTFLAAAQNPLADSISGSPVTTTNVYGAMLAYMSNYIIWATNGFSPSAAPTALKDSQTDLDQTTLKLRNAN